MQDTENFKVNVYVSSNWKKNLSGETVVATQALAKLFFNLEKNRISSNCKMSGI